MGGKRTYDLVTSSYNGYVAIVAAVQEFEVNLWVKDKYESTNTVTTCRERTGEAWIEVKNVNARKMKLEMKFMFVGSKDSSTRNLEAMLYSRGANKQLSYRTHRGLTYLTRTEKMVLSPSSISIARKYGESELSCTAKRSMIKDG